MIISLYRTSLALAKHSFFCIRKLLIDSHTHTVPAMFKHRLIQLDLSSDLILLVCYYFELLVSIARQWNVWCSVQVDDGGLSHSVHLRNSHFFRNHSHVASFCFRRLCFYYRNPGTTKRSLKKSATAPVRKKTRNNILWCRRLVRGIAGRAFGFL